MLDNECPMNFPFLFSYAGRPWKTMEWKSKTLQYFFNATPGGIPGNDDWGSLSSWYAWSALGFFPASPGTEELIIAGPVFEEVTLRLPGERKVTIEAENVSEKNIYIQECRIDGEPYNRPYIRQSDLLRAEKIYFRMGDRPNPEWGLAGPAPYSVTMEQPRFEVSALHPDRAEVRSHEAFRLKASIINTGVIGSYPLKIREGETVIDSLFVLLQPGETKTVERPLRLYEGGATTLSVGDAAGVVLQVQPTDLPPGEALSVTELEVPPLTHMRDSLWWRAEVRNISGQAAEVAPVLYLDDTPVETLSNLTLQPGERARIDGVLPPIPEVGFHDLVLHNSSAIRFKVYEKPAETLVLHYTFDERGDTIVDHSGFGNYGVIVGELEYVKGIKEAGIKVENGYVEVPESPSLIIEDEELTMICWYKPGPKNGKSSLITKGGHNMMKLNGKWQLQLAIGGWGVGQCSYNAPYDAAAGEPVWLGQWSHFAGTRADDGLRVFYNGEMASQLRVKDHIGHTDFKWRIGSNAEIPIGRTPDGVIDEVMIFARALSAAEVRAVKGSY